MKFSFYFLEIRNKLIDHVKRLCNKATPYFDWPPSPTPCPVAHTPFNAENFRSNKTKSKVIKMHNYVVYSNWINLFCDFVILYTYVYPVHVRPMNIIIGESQSETVINWFGWRFVGLSLQSFGKREQKTQKQSIVLALSVGWIRY